METGDVVISKKGRYDGGYFFVVDVGEGFALLADGKTRKLDNPKKKSLKHLTEVNLSSKEVRKRIAEGGNAADALMRAELKRLKNMLQ